MEDVSQLPAMCEQLLANPLVEDYEIVGFMKFGVIQFPGSCDERDALHAASKVGDGGAAVAP